MRYFSSFFFYTRLLFATFCKRIKSKLLQARGCDTQMKPTTLSSIVMRWWVGRKRYYMCVCVCVCARVCVRVLMLIFNGGLISIFSLFPTQAIIIIIIIVVIINQLRGDHGRGVGGEKFILQQQQIRVFRTRRVAQLQCENNGSFYCALIHMYVYIYIHWCYISMHSFIDVCVCKCVTDWLNGRMHDELGARYSFYKCSKIYDCKHAQTCMHTICIHMYIHIYMSSTTAIIVRRAIIILVILAIRKCGSFYSWGLEKYLIHICVYV